MTEFAIVGLGSWGLCVLERAVSRARRTTAPIRLHVVEPGATDPVPAGETPDLKFFRRLWRGPLIANIILEGVRDFEGKPVRATATTYAGLM